MDALRELIDQPSQERQSELVRSGLARASSRGYWVGSQAPYGYVKVYVRDEGKRRVKLDLGPDTHQVVKELFGMAVAGLGDSAIANSLTERGVTGPGGSGWTGAKVRRILRNEVYTGTLVVGELAVRVEDAFPAIVSAEEFDQAQKKV